MLAARHLRLAPLCAALFVPAGACSDDAGSCVESIDSECAPLYEPVYEQVFARTLKPTCGVSGGACHAPEGAKGGLVFDDADEAYRLLVEEGRVTAGDAACSLLVVRLEGGGDGYMPPGAPLSEPERCAVQTWIENGAQRSR